MLYAPSPISEYFLMSLEGREPQVSPAMQGLFDQFTEQVATHLAPGSGGAALPDELLETFFALRLEMLELARREGGAFVQPDFSTANEAAAKYETKDKLAKLQKTTANVREVYREILTALHRKTHLQPGQQASVLPKKPTLHGLRELLAQLPGYLDWAYASLSFEFYWIAVHSVLSGKIVLSEEEAASLARTMRRAFEAFAAASSLSGFWEPTVEDERQLVRNINIVIGIMQADQEIARSKLAKRPSTYAI